MLYQKNIPETMKYDFAVAGGGLTGVCTAVAAARHGLKTILIEQTGMLGGVATAGLVCQLLGGMKFSESGPFPRNVAGLFKEITDKLITQNDAIDPDTIDKKINPHGWFPGLAAGVPFDIEAMKAELDQICLNSGVKLLYFTDIVDVKTDGEKLTHLIVHNKSGLSAISATRFADATGDADVAFMSGCPTVTGRPEDHLVAPASLEFHVDHVDKEKCVKYIVENNEQRFRKLILSLREKGEWDFPYEIFCSSQITEPDTFFINTIRQVGIDGTDADSMTAGMTDGRQEIKKLFGLMKKYFPGFENSRLKTVAPVIGIRETRRIVGDYTLTVEELLKGQIFDDSIAVSSYGWDLPDPKKPSLQPFSGKEKPVYTHIPYRCLIPQNISNLIVAGRSISVERDVLGPIRVMAPCCAMGEAAGLAAVVAAKEGSSFEDVNIGSLHELLKQDNCIYRMG
ncbi:MAG TPA: FAD-dependent oxidoreductase [Oscillospiraceae bacterium]|nr:FAD-dependent oxidoreductase [Oscillospiraceae bacterium]HPF55275.1 FAD-dependent oxidoreductase [Clostridiales bacterium]HPK34679.1 FAD-dependent oxidoreductase [Oscillospiraceae bacterium]HPR74557.1 FAD-dependent oxidoreductase [Oscillospiraceae bacterium]